MEKNKYQMHGVVRIYDQDHNLIQEKNNMIVESGRRKILNVLFNSKVKTPNFLYFYELGSTQHLTEPTSVYDPNAIEVPAQATKAENTQSSFTYTMNEDEIKVVYTATIEWDNAKSVYQPILAVGLFWKEKNNNYLFSRAAIDPIYMNPNRKYIVEHTVYL